MHPPLPSNLVNAINDAPDDDAPRLAAADWFRENGAADRADFIGLQMEMARLGKVRCHQPGADLGDGCDDSLCPRCGPEHVLAGREQELLDVAAAEFWAEFPGCVTDWWWVRGFVEKVRVDAVSWAALADAWLASHPLRTVVFDDVPDDRVIQHRQSAPYTHEYRVFSRERWHPEPACEVRGDGSIVLGLFSLEWDGLTFELPPPVEFRPITAQWDTSFTDIPTQLQRLRDEIIRQHGIPPHLVG
jgi:uncharacterized protein (TIGR02996 family)